MPLNSDHQTHGISPEAQQNNTIITPKCSLVVLCGPAGSGKSTFARRIIEQHQEQDLKATAIVSSDRCRALVCDDEAMRTVTADQQKLVQQHTFELFYSILAKRLALGRFSIADTLALHKNIRRALLEIARKCHVPTCLVVFHMSLQTCLEQNRRQIRTHVIPEQMVAYQVEQLPQVLPSIPHEGWDQIYTLDEHHRDVNLVIAPA